MTLCGQEHLNVLGRRVEDSGKVGWARHVCDCVERLESSEFLEEWQAEEMRTAIVEDRPWNRRKVRATNFRQDFKTLGLLWIRAFRGRNYVSAKGGPEVLQVFRPELLQETVLPSEQSNNASTRITYRGKQRVQL